MDHLNMSKRLTTYSVEGFYLGVLAGMAGMSVMHIQLPSEAYIFVIIAVSLLFSALGFAVATVLNSRGWPDERVTTWGVWRDILFIGPFGLGLPLVLFLFVIFTLARHFGFDILAF